MTPQYDGYVRLTCPVIAGYDKKPKLATASMSPAAVRQSALYQRDMADRRRFLASQTKARDAEKRLRDQVSGRAA